MAVASQPATEAEQPAEPATQPTSWVWNEASLPAGFPPPGKVGQVLIKNYPAYRAARTKASDVGGENRMFGTLFDHIKKNNIPMTAPVEMTYAPDGKTYQQADMLFMYESPDKPRGTTQPGVEVLDIPPATVVSVGVRGGYSKGNFEASLAKLETYLSAHPEWQRAGPPRVLGYNSPFIPWFLRYSEVQIPVCALTFTPSTCLTGVAERR